MKLNKQSFLVMLSFLVWSVVSGQQINQYDAQGKRNGLWKKFYKSGQLRYQGQFSHGKEEGVFKFYQNSSSTQPAIVKEFTTNSDLATVSFFDKKGRLKTVGKMRGKNRVGEWRYFYANKSIFSKENYKDGKLEGLVVNYYPNGKITNQTTYKNDKKDGLSKVFTDDGILIEEVHYLQGKLHGTAKYYDMKGNLKEAGSYENGLKVGQWDFYMDGEIVKKPKREILSEE